MFKKQFLSLTLIMTMSIFSQNLFAEIFLSHTQVTDVTPSGFSVVWHSSEAATPRIEVYSDALATQEVTSQLEIILFPLQGAASGLSTAYEQSQSKLALQSTVKQKGLNKIQVRGLTPESNYFVKVFSESSIDSGNWPATGTHPVTTQKENSFLQDSAIVVIDIHDVDARGWIVLVSTATSTHPVSSYTEAGAAPGQAVVNLSNLFGTDGTNWFSNLTTALTIQVIKGNGEVTTDTLNINLGDSFAVASNYPFNIGSPFDAIIQIVSPSQKVYSTGENIKLAWTDEAATVNATISLYLDVDTSGEDGVQIATGIAEDPDGIDDEFDLNVSTINEGSYYVYAVMSDGQNTVSSYGSAKITIDHNQTDGDNDQLSDLWETHYFDTLARDGTEDFDGDGISDTLEKFYAVNPEQVNDPLQGLTLALNKGAHIVGVPGMLVPRLSSFGLLSQLGTAVQSISRFNHSTNLREITFWENGIPSGTDFFLLSGEGYFVQMLEDANVAWTTFDDYKEVPLKTGVNVIALTAPTGDAFGLLNQLGSDVIWSIRRLNPKSSLYETAAFDGTETVGNTFPLKFGEGYIVTVKQASTIN